MVGRITHPMAYDAASDRYLPVAWSEAFDVIGRHLRALSDPNMADFYTSGRTSNEAAFLYQLFVREYGTNNFPDCSKCVTRPPGLAFRIRSVSGRRISFLVAIAVCLSRAKHSFSCKV